MSTDEYKTLPRAEYETRWEKAKKLLLDKGLDIILVMEPYNYNYFTGASPSFSYTRSTIFFLTKEGRKVVLVHEFVQESTRRETWIDDVRIYRDLVRAPVGEMKGIVMELGLPSGKIGAELGYEQRLGIPYSDFLALQRDLPDATFVDASDVLWKIRMVKSSEEIKRLRKASMITSEAFETLFEHAERGMTEIEFSRLFLQDMSKRGASNPWCFVSSGPYNYSLTSAKPTRHKLREGNTVWIDGGCSFEGYWSDFCRNASVGKPSDKQVQLHSTIVEITSSMLETLKPGARVSEICKNTEANIAKRGLELTFRAGRLGHGIGLMLTEPPHMASYDQTVLEPNMVVTVEPGFVTEYGCFQNEQDVLITKNGHEVLSKAGSALRRI
jgi:Xaa-Pro aminopeptidase